MNRIIETVPNFSEGRNPETIRAIVSAAAAVPGAAVLSWELDGDHNRSVVTIAGDPEAVSEASFAAMAVAAERIDLTGHEGQHPRMGATDVMPFVPISGVTLEDCAEFAAQFGERAGRELDIPVFLYGEAATRPSRRNLAHVRKPQFEGLRDAIGADPDWTPDFGPNQIHQTAGATAVGARFFLIAYNVQLDTDDVGIAKRIAKTIREASGGLPGVKALGLFLAEKNLAQVSMNLVDYRLTSPARVFAEIRRLALEAGCDVVDSELIGLIPRDALIQSAAEALTITDFSPGAIIEEALDRDARGTDSAR